MLEIYLPSGRSDTRIDKITADSMSSLYNAQKYKLPDLLVDTLARFTNIDIRSMYLEDFRYMLAMFDRDSWPTSHRTYEWRCVQNFFVDMTGNRYYTKPKGKISRSIPCDMLNTEEVSKYRVVTNKWQQPPQGLCNPTVSRWIEAYTASEDIGSIALTAMYIDSDLSIIDTLNNISPDELMRASSYAWSICELETTFKCGRCFREYVQRTPIDLLGYLRTFSDTSMMNMSMDLTTSKGAYIPDNIPISKLLYWHSCFLKDLQKAKEEAAMAAGKRTRGK